MRKCRVFSSQWGPPETRNRETINKRPRTADPRFMIIHEATNTSKHAISARPVKIDTAFCTQPTISAAEWCSKRVYFAVCPRSVGRVHASSDQKSRICSKVTRDVCVLQCSRIAWTRGTFPFKKHILCCIFTVSGRMGIVQERGSAVRERL